MSYQITNLKKSIYSLISGEDRIIVTDVTSSIGEVETKTIELNELKKLFHSFTIFYFLYLISYILS